MQDRELTKDEIIKALSRALRRALQNHPLGTDPVRQDVKKILGEVYEEVLHGS
jgi:hypothetical protein